MNILQRLILGTAQLGMPYGIANKTGKPAQDTADKIVQTTLDYGVSGFDTAHGYGNSELVLGLALKKSKYPLDQVQIITKLPAILSSETTSFIREYVDESISHLGVRSLSVLMFHREEHLALLSGNVGQLITQLLNEGLLMTFGVSTYTPKAALKAIRHPLVSIVQIPANLFDRRFEAAGIFAEAEQAGKIVHIRSALLQGVLCMAPEQLPHFLGDIRPALLRFQNICRESHVPFAPTAIAWLLLRYPLAQVLFGAETSEQVVMNLDFIRQTDIISPYLWKELDAVVPPQKEIFLNPSRWNI